MQNQALTSGLFSLDVGQSQERALQCDECGPLIMQAFSMKEWISDKDAVKAAFTRDGFVHIKDFFGKDQCSKAVEAIHKLESQTQECNSVAIVTESINGGAMVKYYQGIYSLDSSFKRFFDLRLLLVAATLLGTEEVYYADLEAHLRNPGGGEIPKHQDNFYFNLRSARGLTAYIALTSHDASSGGLNYKLRSHSRVVNHEASRIAGFSSFIDEDGSQETKVNVYAPAYDIGDLSIHHPNNIHWSRPCPSDAIRAYALSARVFDKAEVIDEDGVARYQRLLAKNRQSKH